MSAPGEAKPARPDRVAGRALSPRSFRPFGVEAVVLGAPSGQEGLVRREGVALWRRLPEHAPVFDRAAAGTAAVPDAGGVLAVRVVVATTPARDRALRVPALGERAARALAVAERPPPATGWLLLVDEGPGEVWLYLAEEDHPIWQIVNIWQASEPFRQLIHHPKITKGLAQLTGAKELRIWHDQIQYKPAAIGGVNMWHQDAP